MSVRGEPLAEYEAELVDGTAGQRSVGQLLLFGPVEEVQEGCHLALGARRPATGTPGTALLQLHEVGPLTVGERRLMQGEQAGELGLQLFDSICHRIPRIYRRR